MRYTVYGPFAAPRLTSGALDRSDLRPFWEEVEGWQAGLARATGIYVYASLHGSTYTPWYVGKTCAETGFRGEVFQGHKVDHYLRSETFKRGARYIHLIARVTPERGAFSKPSKTARREIDLLETMVIGMALRANPLVSNEKKTWFNRTLCVPGIIGDPQPGRRTEAARTLRKVLHLD